MTRVTIVDSGRAVYAGVAARPKRDVQAPFGAFGFREDAWQDFIMFQSGDWNFCNIVQPRMQSRITRANWWAAPGPARWKWGLMVIRVRRCYSTSRWDTGETWMGTREGHFLLSEGLRKPSSVPSLATSSPGPVSDTSASAMGPEQIQVCLPL